MNSILAPWTPVFLKRCRVPRGMKTKSPVPAMKVRAPSRISSSPERTKKASSVLVWTWAIGPPPGGTVASTSASEPLVDSRDALIVYVSPANHVVGPSPAGTWTARLVRYRGSWVSSNFSAVRDMCGSFLGLRAKRGGGASEADRLPDDDDVDAAGVLLLDLEDLSDAAVHAVGGERAGVLQFQAVLVDALARRFDRGHELLRADGEDDVGSSP